MDRTLLDLALERAREQRVYRCSKCGAPGRRTDHCPHCRGLLPPLPGALDALLAQRQAEAKRKRAWRTPSVPTNHIVHLEPNPWALWVRVPRDDHWGLT